MQNIIVNRIIDITSTFDVSPAPVLSLSRMRKISRKLKSDHFIIKFQKIDIFFGNTILNVEVANGLRVAIKMQTMNTQKPKQSIC